MSTGHELEGEKYSPAQRARTSMQVKNDVRYGIYEDAKAAVAEELDCDPTQTQVIREVCAAYVGYDK
ncbi:hypothetical protein [Halogeometricum luteum]|uniref:Ribbon-helix-helix protein, copG family n=1 Tax=Halogeometricum luteum TaxID=2950537 RepID=A0ABU2G8J2_9EURY|nr:hypothetical protein [Halogeometricum sp. S3BR5-2]MDS0297116.1 hypothetical protein [Halogeometricum sp. S3BR5-2]